jgi:hypothetical protein
VTINLRHAAALVVVDCPKRRENRDAELLPYELWKSDQRAFYGRSGE